MPKYIRPSRYPLHDQTGTNSVPLPTIYEVNGFPPVSVADARATNALLGAGGDYISYLDVGNIHNEDIHLTATPYRLSSGNFTWPIGAGLASLESVSEPVYLVRGRRYKLTATYQSDAGIRPFSFLPTTTTWFYLDIDGAIRVDIQALGSPPTPGPDEFVLVGVDTNATDVTALDYTGAPSRKLPFVGPAVDFASDIEGNAATFEQLTTGGNLSAQPSLTVIPSPGAVSVFVTGNGTDIACGIDGDTAQALGLVSASNDPTLEVTNTGAGASHAVLVTCTSGSAIAVEGRSSGNASGIVGVGGATGGAGVEGTAQASGAAGARGIGAAFADSPGVLGEAQHVDAAAVEGRSLAGSSTTATAVLGTAVDDATGVKGVATDGYGVVAQSNTFAPARAALRMVPQTSAPTTPLAGDVYVNSTINNSLQRYTGTQWHIVHSSLSGSLFGLSAFNSGLNVGTSGNICNVSISPEGGGTVLLEVNGMWNGRTDTTTMTITFHDFTAAADIYTSQPLNSLDIDSAGTTGRTMPFCARYAYVLPSVATRNFRVRLDASATFDWWDVFLTVRGVY